MQELPLKPICFFSSLRNIPKPWNPTGIYQRPFEHHLFIIVGLNLQLGFIVLNSMRIVFFDSFLST